MLSNMGVNFTTISPRGSEWYFNDPTAMRNFSRLVRDHIEEVISDAIFLHSTTILKNFDGTKSVGVGELLSEVDLEKMTIPKHVPAKVCY